MAPSIQRSWQNHALLPATLQPAHPPTHPSHPLVSSLKPCAPAEQLRLDIEARRQEQQALDDAW